MWRTTSTTNECVAVAHAMLRSHCLLRRNWVIAHARWRLYNDKTCYLLTSVRWWTILVRNVTVSTDVMNHDLRLLLSDKWVGKSIRHVVDEDRIIVRLILVVWATLLVWGWHEHGRRLSAQYCVEQNFGSSCSCRISLRMSLQQDCTSKDSRAVYFRRANVSIFQSCPAFSADLNPSHPIRY